MLASPLPPSFLGTYSLWTSSLGCNALCILLLLLLFVRFSHQHNLMVLQWSLSNSKSLQVSKNLLHILTDLNNAIIGWSWFVLQFPTVLTPFSSLLEPTRGEFFRSELSGCHSREFEWQQVSSILLDSFKYSGRSKQWHILDSLHSSTDLKLFHSSYQSYNWYHCCSLIPQLFFVLWFKAFLLFS